MTKFDVLKRQSQLMSKKIHAASVEKRVRRTLLNIAPAPTDVVEFVLFFADGPGQSYQLEQWTAPFEALRKRGYGVCLLVMDALSARTLAQQTNLPILLMRSMEKIETALASWGTIGVFYVNNSQANFTMLRVSGPAHVHLSHGESEKSSMVSNQLKAYDFAFIAGPAAKRRILATIPRFDPAKLIEIGRPQLDYEHSKPAVQHPGSRIRVLYAPTWEGDGQSMAYSSITSIGVGLINALIDDGRFTVVFRPHPKTGSWSSKARHELALIRKTMATAMSKTPEAGHLVDVTVDSAPGIIDADVVICDISAMAMDSVGLNRPLLLLHSVETTMAKDLAPEQTLSMERASKMLTEDHGRALLNAIANAGKSNPSMQQQSLRNTIFGDPTLGRPTDRFINATISVTSAATRE